MLGLLNYAKNNAITIKKEPNNMHGWIVDIKCLFLGKHFIYG